MVVVVAIIATRRHSSLIFKKVKDHHKIAIFLFFPFLNIYVNHDFLPINFQLKIWIYL